MFEISDRLEHPDITRACTYGIDLDPVAPELEYCKMCGEVYSPADTDYGVCEECLADAQTDREWAYGYVSEFADATDIENAAYDIQRALKHTDVEKIKRGCKTSGLISMLSFLYAICAHERDVDVIIRDIVENDIQHYIDWYQRRRRV